MRRRTAYIGSGRAMGGNVMWNRMNNRAKKRRKFIPLLWNSGNKLANNLNLGFGNRSRGPGSMVSRIRNYKLDVSVKPVGTGSSYSYYKYTRTPDRGSRIVKTQQAPLYSVYNSGTRMTSAQGQQGYVSLTVMTALQLHQLYLETSANQDGQFWVGSARCKWMFQNQSEANTFLTIYEIATRRDSIAGPTNAFSTGMASIQGGVSSTADDIGATPFMTTRFTENFRIMKKYNVELAQGRTHIHTAYYNMHKNYRDSIYQMDGPDDVVLGGWTRGLFVIAHGSPYNSAAVKTNVSTTPVAIDIVSNIAFKTYTNLVNKSVFEIQSDFTTFTDGQIMDIGSGEADALNDA